MKKSILFFLIIFSFFQAQSQNKEFSKDYLKRNILDRGYDSPLYLTSKEESVFFLVKNGRSSAIVVIHDIGYDDSILELKSRGSYSTFLDYEKENTLSLNLIDIITKKNPTLFENYKGNCKIYHYVKDVVFERNPDDHKDDPEESIISTSMWQGMDGNSPWKLAKLNKLNVNNSVNQAIKSGKKLVSSSKFVKNVENEKEERENIIVKTKIKAKISNSGLLFYPDSFWQKTFDNKGGQVLKNCFNGDFNLISKKDINRFLYEFLISYYESCGKTFSKQEDYVDSIYAERIAAPGSQSVDISDPYFYYRREIKIHKKFIEKFNQLDGFWRLEKNANEFYWDCHFFIENARCDSKELNQLLENVSRLINGKNSLQNKD